MRTPITKIIDRLRDDELGFASYIAAVQVLFVRCVGAAAGYGSQILLARVLGQTEYGIFALTWIWVMIIGHLAPAGFNHSVCRFAAHYYERREMEELRGFLRLGAIVTVSCGLASALLGGLVLWFGQSWFDSIYVAPFAVALIIIPVFALQDYVEGIARAFNWPVLALAPTYVIRNVAIGLGMLAAVWLGAPGTAWTAACVLFGAVLLCFIIQASLVFNRLRKLIPRGSRRYSIRHWCLTTVPLLLVDGTQLLFTNIDILILSLFLDPATIAVYFAASRILQLVAFVPFAASAATLQRYSALSAADEMDEVRRLAQNTTRLTVGLSLLLIVTILPLSPFLLGMFGADFTAGVPVLAILMLGVFAQALAGPGEDLLNMLGHERACAAAFFSALVVNVILNFALIPHFGLIGAAIATAVSIAIRSVLLALLVKSRIDVNIFFTLPGGLAFFRTPETGKAEA